jgi:HEAT repeat protein
MMELKHVKDWSWIHKKIHILCIQLQSQLLPDWIVNRLKEKRKPENLLKMIRDGKPVEAMEAAKYIDLNNIPVNILDLERIARRRHSRKWTRIAAMYVLGWRGDRSVVPTLMGILENPNESSAIRDNAAEALGNLGDPHALVLLERIASETTSPVVKRSCEFALAVIPNRGSSTQT